MSNLPKNEPHQELWKEKPSRFSRASIPRFFIDFALSVKVKRDKKGVVIEASRKDVEGMNGEIAWILISDAQTRMLHGDTRLSKSSPVKYLESFLQQYSPECKNKWVVLNKAENCTEVLMSEISSSDTSTRSILLDLIPYLRMVPLNELTVPSRMVSKVA